MTGLSKDLITCIKRSSHHSSDASSAKHPAPRRFKECMKRENQSLDTSEEELDQRSRREGPVYTPISFSQPLSWSTSASPASGASLMPVAEVQALFEKMASTMLILHTEGGQETTFLLDSPQFASSSLFGTRITIREFSTAPKVFNIEIASHQTGLHLLATHKDALLGAFESHKLPFTVHRLEIELHGVENSLSYHNANEDEQQQQKEDERS